MVAASQPAPAAPPVRTWRGVVASWFDPSQHPPPKPSSRFWSLDSSGGRIAAAAQAMALACTIAAPLERVRIMMQTQTEMRAAPYKSIADTCRRVVAAEGSWMALWRGNLTAVFRCVTTVALHRTLKEAYYPFANKLCVAVSSLVSPPQPPEAAQSEGPAGAVQAPPLGPSTAASMASVSEAGHSLAVGLASFTTLFVMHPFEYARTRLAADRFAQFRNPIVMITRTINDRSYFVGGLYSGFLPACVGLATYCGVSLGMYMAVMYTAEASPLLDAGDIMTHFYIGGVSTIAAHAAAYPFDTMKRRLMLLGLNIHEFKGGLGYLHHVLRQNYDGGWRGLYRGFGVTALHHVVFGGVMLACLFVSPVSAVAY